MVHVPGKQLCIADTLSRAPTSRPTSTDAALEEVAYIAMTTFFAHLPVGTGKLCEYASKQDSDPICSLVKKYTKVRWPDKHRNWTKAEAILG